MASLHKTSNKIVALKTIDLDDASEEVEEVQSELRVLVECASTNIVKYEST